MDGNTDNERKVSSNEATTMGKRHLVIEEKVSPVENGEVQKDKKVLVKMICKFFSLSKH